MATWVLFHTRFVRNFVLKITQWRLNSSRTLKISNDSDSGSDISVSTVNTEDLSNLSFSKDEDDRPEIGWSRDDSPVYVTAFTAAIGATSTVPEQYSTAKDFCLFVTEELLENIVEETNH